MNKIFYNGKGWMGFIAPEKPIGEYNAAYATAKAGALPILNPEIVKGDTFKWHPDIRSFSQFLENKDYDWPGDMKLENKFIDPYKISVYQVKTEGYILSLPNSKDEKPSGELELALHDAHLKSCFYNHEYAPFMMEVFKKFSLYESHETIATGSTDISAKKDESKMKTEWILSRVKMPDFDGYYYVYGFQYHECGNVTSFHQVVECRMNQWVKPDVGHQMTYWRPLLTPPEITDEEKDYHNQL